MSQENQVPRRYQVDQYTPAELAVRKAITEVEALEASEELTNIITKLVEAKNQLHDYVEKSL